MSQEDIVLENDSGIAILTLNRPERLNALDTPAKERLTEVLRQVDLDDEARVVVITGAGKGFCSGIDVDRLEALRTKQAPVPLSRRAMMSPAGEVALLIRALRQPTIAAVNGVAAGLGLSIALACDLRLASTTARFAAVWVRRGLMPDGAASFLLPQIVGTAKALELMYTGDTMDADEAARLGLVTRVVPSDQLIPAARELAAKIASGPSVSIELIKRAVYHDDTQMMRTHLFVETHGQRVCRETEDHKEGMKAFQEKRAPQFQGR